MVAMPDSASLAWSRPDAPHQLDRQIVEEGQLRRRVDEAEAIGFGHLRADLGEVLGARHAHRDRQSDLLAHALRIASATAHGRAEEVGGAGDVGEGLVDRDCVRLTA